MTEPGVASELLLELASRYGDDGPTLVLGGEASLPNSLDGEVIFAPTDVREREASQVPVTANPAPNSVGTVLIPAPPDRDLLRRQLIVASRTAVPEGRILICGANAEGGKTAIRDAADLLGNPIWSGYREKHRMAIFEREVLLSPAWAIEPGIGPGTWRSFTAKTPVGELRLHTQAGVFAGAKIDAGTRLLLEHLSVEQDAYVLDIGCGVGIIGIVAAKMGAGQVTMADANLLAVQATTHNVDSVGINASVLASDVYHHIGNESFDLIVSNPPFHRSKQVDLNVANEIITGAAERLNPGGSLLLVANAFLAYGKQISEVFERVETIAATPQYHVLRGSLD